jgi:hypothetical protein
MSSSLPRPSAPLYCRLLAMLSVDDMTDPRPARSLTGEELRIGRVVCNGSTRRTYRMPWESGLLMA